MVESPTITPTRTEIPGPKTPTETREDAEESGGSEGTEGDPEMDEVLRQKGADAVRAEKAAGKEPDLVCACGRRFRELSGLEQHQRWNRHCVACQASKTRTPRQKCQAQAKSIARAREHAYYEERGDTWVEGKAAKRRRPVTPSPTPPRRSRRPSRRPPSTSSSPRPIRKKRGGGGGRELHVHVH